MTFTDDRPGGARSHHGAAPLPTDTMPRLLSAADLAELFALSVAEIAVAATPANVPDMNPPGSLSRESSVGVAISGQLITALWAEQSNRNAWVFLQSSGWKRLDPLTDTGSTALTLLSAHARATGSAPYADENPAGTINMLYVW